jgi:hypothetical protein
MDGLVEGPVEGRALGGGVRASESGGLAVVVGSAFPVVGSVTPVPESVPPVVADWGSRVIRGGVDGRPFMAAATLAAPISTARPEVPAMNRGTFLLLRRGSAGACGLAVPGWWEDG